MSLLSLINAAVNLAICVALYYLLLRAWGNPKSKVYDRPVLAYFRKAGICVTICGAVFNAFGHKQPAMPEVVLNAAVACNFVSIALLFPALKKSAPKKAGAAVRRRPGQLTRPSEVKSRN